MKRGKRAIKEKKESLQARIDFISGQIRENKIEHHQLQSELHEQLKEFEIRRIEVELKELQKQLKGLEDK
tara:strand:+ start:673 stop:882 length:210 start_codon:yes stop_codon:yes gene_type:complete